MSIPSLVARNASFELPVEVVQEILKKLPRRNLKSLRLSLKALAEQTTPLIFNAVFLSPDPMDIEKTASVFAAFKSSIRTLIISPFFFDEISMTRYEKCVQRGAQYKSYIETFPNAKPHRFAEHIKKGYKGLKSRNRVENIPTKHLLRRIIQHAPDIWKLIVTDRRRAMDLTGSELAKFCCWEDCTSAPEMHAMFRLTPAQAKEHRKPWLLTDCFQLIFTSGSGLRDLRVEQAKLEYDGYRLTTRDILEGVIGFHSQVQAFMASLTTLNLDVDTEFVPYQPPAGPVFQEPIGFLGQARNVEVLALRVLSCRDGGSPCTYASKFDHILRDGHFPRLRTFRLSDCSMTYDELLSFLKGSPNINTLSLHSCVLKTPCWMSVLEEYIKARSQIKTLSLRDITGCFGLYGESGPEFYDGDGVNHSIEDFLLRNGPNPFDTQGPEAKQKIRALAIQEQ